MGPKPSAQTAKQTYSTIKYHLSNRVIKIQFLGGLPTDYQPRYRDTFQNARIWAIPKQIRCKQMTPAELFYITTYIRLQYNLPTLFGIILKSEFHCSLHK